MLDMSQNPIATDPDFAEAVLAGLARPQKAISSAWLYDERGSALYEDITRQPEYYVARTETGILRAAAAEIASHLPEKATLIEYGAGAAVKTRLILDALRPAVYAPLDISAEFLLEASNAVAVDYPDIRVMPLVAHFLGEADMSALTGHDRRVGFFPGSTIGNLTNDEIVTFFTLCRTQLGGDGRLLLGADRAKDPAILCPAYDDAAGVTAAFNLNLLHRINRELAGNFDVDRFHHEARFNAEASRMEMHIVSDGQQTVNVLDRTFRFADQESIHTEISRKFRDGEVEAIADRAGWTVEERWTDDDAYFNVILFRQT